ncbi:MAG: CsgG/HfaB family protein [Zoogloeaceae bacterium]|jgi:hypothetical protein|nr:CsgG/HfaB family protein [Zoogloeaceae bacterium]
MNRPSRLAFATLATLVLFTACGKKETPEPAHDAAPASVSSQPAPQALAEKPLRSTPDFGGNTSVFREVEGIGATPEQAVLAALQSAVAQVNGTKVASQLQDLQAEMTLSATAAGPGAPSGKVFVRSELFDKRVSAASSGTVLGYEILSQEAIDKPDTETTARVRASDGGYHYSASGSIKTEGEASARDTASQTGSRERASASISREGQFSYREKGEIEAERGKSTYESDVNHKTMRSYWKVSVRAEIAQYRAPDEQGRPKIVVALPRTSGGGYVVGDTRVTTNTVARAIRGRLSDLLSQTGRFIVLDRESDAELDAELARIDSGRVRTQDAARTGQQLATDLILIPTLERFEYRKQVRSLRLSDRQVTSWSGGGRIALRLVHAATGEVAFSAHFDYDLPATGPSTLPRAVDGQGMANTMMDALAGDIGQAIVTRLFPVAVVTLQGDQVVLSQGGDSLRAGQRWQAVILGEALTDPQTGRPLGRSELPCCTIRIDRVATQTAYGTIEDPVSLQNLVFRPGLIELRQPLLAAATSTSTSRPRASKAAKSTAPAREKDDPNW